MGRPPNIEQVERVQKELLTGPQPGVILLLNAFNLMLFTLEIVKGDWAEPW